MMAQKPQLKSPHLLFTPVHLSPRSPSTASSSSGDESAYEKSHYFSAGSREIRKLPTDHAVLPSPPVTPAKSRMIKHYEDVDLASDSPLSDPPSDLENPFSDNDILIQKSARSVPKSKPRRRNYTKSPYFPKKPNKQVSCLPFPSIDAATFGLMQERLAHDPFRMLVATIFLNRTRGEQAMPVYFKLMERYPTVSELAQAQHEDVVAIIHKLGFQNQRARKCIELAKAWLERSPVKGKRFRKLDYPRKGDGRDIKAEEILDDEDPRVAWEVGGYPGVGAYAVDSWRIFCRDKLRGMAYSWNGEGTTSADFEPEWTRVIPTDKELRAYLAWMWLKRGFIWNKQTGERKKADEEVLERARKGGYVREDSTDWILEIPSKEETADALAVTETAGAFLPEEEAEVKPSLAAIPVQEIRIKSK
ncbi:MAG: hypothetical protein Q9227_006066 [Pyrenula ochraceoflavens]